MDDSLKTPAVARAQLWRAGLTLEIAALFLFLLFCVVGHFLRAPTVVSSALSPSGLWRLALSRSAADGAVDHAPYGYTLQLVSIRQPWLGDIPPDVVFAGYCAGSLSYRWDGDARVLVHCPNANTAERAAQIRTHAVRVRGIDVTLVESPL